MKAWMEAAALQKWWSPVEFRKVPKGTELALTHELLPTGAARDTQRTEWLGRLERLGQILA